MGERMAIFRRRPPRTTIVVVVVSVLCGACASLVDTPAQELAMSRWATCHQSVNGAELKRVQPDGRIIFWYSGTSDGRSMVECLQQAAKSGPSLPDPISEARPAGSGGGGGGGGM